MCLYRQILPILKTMKNKLSIILPTCNSEKTIGYTLKSILIQDFKNVEIVVIDCYSKDQTMSIIDSFSKMLNIYVLKSKARLLMARLLGVRNSEGDILLFLDSDQVLSSSTLRRIVELIERDYNVLILEEKSLSRRINLSSRLIARNRVLVHNLLRKGVTVSTFPRVYKRELLESISNLAMKTHMFKCLYNVNLFDDRITFGLVKMIYKNKLKLGIVDNAVYHIEPTTLSDLFIKYINYGKNFKFYMKYATKEGRLCKEMLENLTSVKFSFLSIRGYLNLLRDPILIVKYVAYLLGNLLI